MFSVVAARSLILVSVEMARPTRRRTSIFIQIPTFRRHCMIEVGFCIQFEKFKQVSIDALVEFHIPSFPEVSYSLYCGTDVPVTPRVQGRALGTPVHFTKPRQCP
jgi:hypothetical protein